MTSLRGHSRPVKIVFLTYVLDHTYATCAGGHCWRCWGDCEGGTILQTGEASSARADCIGMPDSQAGIIYGITGLCHQSANRILSPAKVTINDADGYVITEFFFGAYGSKASEWETRRAACAKVIGEIPTCQDVADAPDVPPSDEDAGFLDWIIALYERLAGQEEREGTAEGPTPPNLDLLGRLLEARVKHVLGQGYSEDRIREMQGIQRACLVDKTELDRNLLAGRMAGVVFAERANARINRALRAFREVLGAEDYQRLFKLDASLDPALDPKVEITVIRPDICKTVYDDRMSSSGNEQSNA